MRLTLSLAIAAVCLIAANVGSAQDPQFRTPAISGPVFLGPESFLGSESEGTLQPIPSRNRSGTDAQGSPVIGTEGTVYAQQGLPSPYAVPESNIYPGPMIPNGNLGGAGPVIVAPQVDAPPMLLSDCSCDFYSRVRYKDKKHIAPCADTMVVSIIDPCSRKHDCETRCVQVKICVPACDCPKAKVSRSGRHVRYDFGKYAVDIFSNRNGEVVVDYDA